MQYKKTSDIIILGFKKEAIMRMWRNGRRTRLKILRRWLRAGSSPAIRTIFLKIKYARVVELADSLDSGSSAHYGRAGSSPASRTKSDTNFDTMGIRLVSDFFAPWGGRFCMSRHSVFSHAVRWRSARDPWFHFFKQESRVRKVLETRRVRSPAKAKKEVPKPYGFRTSSCHNSTL